MNNLANLSNNWPKKLTLFLIQTKLKLLSLSSCNF